jgi:hypothetical protein
MSRIQNMENELFDYRITGGVFYTISGDENVARFS